MREGGRGGGGEEGKGKVITQRKEIVETCVREETREIGDEGDSGDLCTPYL